MLACHGVPGVSGEQIPVQWSLDANHRSKMLGNAPRIEVAVPKHQLIIHVARATASPRLMPNTGSSIRKGCTSHAGYSRPGSCPNFGEKAMRLCQKWRSFHDKITARRRKQVSNLDGTHRNESYHAQKDLKASCPHIRVPYRLEFWWKKD